MAAMSERKYKGLLSNIVIFGLGTFGSKIITFFLLPLYTNLLTTEEYGIADLLFSCSELVRAFVSVTIYNGLLRFGLSKDYNRKDVFRIATIVFVLGTFATVILTPLFDLYTAIAKWKWFVAANVIAVFASKNVLIYLKILQKNKLYSFLNILQAFIIAVGSILFLAVMHRGLQGYLIVTVVAPLLVSVIGFCSGGEYKDLYSSKWNKSLFRKMILYSLPFIVSDISWWVIHSSDKVMLEYIVNVQALGLYAAAAKISLLINVVISIFNQAWDISVIEEFEKDNDAVFYKTVYRSFIILIFAIAMCIVLIIRPFMNFYVGSDFRQSWKYIPLLTMASIFAAVNTTNTSFLIAMKKSKVVMLITVVGAVLNILINYLLIGKIEIWGAVIGTLLAYFTMSCISILFVKKYMHMDMCVGLTCILCACMIVQTAAVNLDFYPILISCIVLGVVLFFIRKDVLEHIFHWK